LNSSKPFKPKNGEYNVLESTWYWIDNSQNYKTGNVKPGKYTIDKTYKYNGNKYIHLKNLGWMITEKIKELLNPQVEISYYACEEVTDEGIEPEVSLGKLSSKYNLKKYKIE